MWPCQDDPVFGRTGGGFDLVDTQYQDTCALSPPCFGPPPVRFWGFNSYWGANYGCGWPGLPGGEWVINPSVDVGFTCPAGHWVFYQTNWQDPCRQGCPQMAPTVAEVSNLCPQGPLACTVTGQEGTVAHSSWYLLASVDSHGGLYDFDREKGEDDPDADTVAWDCKTGDLRRRPVPALTIEGRSEPCVNAATMKTEGEANKENPSYTDVYVYLDDPTPDYFTEVGKNDPARRLIDGYEILFAEGAEPVTSDPAAWQSARDPADPEDYLLGIVPYGTHRVQVTIGPTLESTDYWLAARLVYTDCSLNKSAVEPVGHSCHRDPSPNPPLIVSKVSGHCGPVIVETP